MKKLVVLFFALVLTTSVAFSATVEKERGYISTSVTLTKEVDPNIAQISFNVNTSDKDSKVASEKNNKITQTLIAELKKNIDTKSDEKIFTSGYSINQEYSYNNGKKHFEKFVVNNSVNVEIKDIKKISSVIDAGIKAGATSVLGISLKIDNADSVKTDLIKQATLKLKNNAETVATALGTKLDGIKYISINDYNSSVLNRTFDTAAMGAAKMMNASASVEENSTPFEVGKIVIRVSANADFFVK